MRIGLTAILAAAFAAALPSAALAQAGPPVRARQAFGQCLNRVVKDELPNKLDPDAVTARLKSACAAEANGFRTAWITYEVSMKARRSEAEQNADAQIDDYLQNAVDTYGDSVQPHERPKPDRGGGDRGS